MSQKVATYHGAGTCKRSCCWTPYGNCARDWTCAHHRDAAAIEGRKARQEQVIRDLVRAALTTSRGGRR
ncbi:hypothetical protein ABDK96_01920 [Citricoccus nitrophenolicus]|uniref:Uncharacterized protein n=1 Tax=Citricoccus nitrophenolicus TaxID=863575 RepID=A0ABV0IE47_9MICC